MKFGQISNFAFLYCSSIIVVVVVSPRRICCSVELRKMENIECESKLCANSFIFNKRLILIGEEATAQSFTKEEALIAARGMEKWEKCWETFNDCKKTCFIVFQTSIVAIVCHPHCLVSCVRHRKFCFLQYVQVVLLWHSFFC